MGGNLQNEICKSDKTDSQDFDFFDLSRNLGIPSFNHFSATRSVPPRGCLFESWVRKLDMFMCTYRGIRVSKSMKDDWTEGIMPIEENKTKTLPYDMSHTLTRLSFLFLRTGFDDSPGDVSLFVCTTSPSLDCSLLVF